tara:strand:- start:406 stop:624 length:219 start_codon:yes stop_codon:yes gene_type:complete
MNTQSPRDLLHDLDDVIAPQEPRTNTPTAYMVPSELVERVKDYLYAEQRAAKHTQCRVIPIHAAKHTPDGAA